MKQNIKQWIAVLFSLVAMSAAAEVKTIHVLVALCDNEYQGIVKVPEKIGNGQDAKNNLYWGAAYGVKTYLKKQPEWSLVKTQERVFPWILERVVFKHKNKEIFLVADAYDGQFIKQATQDFLGFSAGYGTQSVEIEDKALAIAGKANLVVYVGHNGLMDFSLPVNVVADEQMQLSNKNRVSAVFACYSDRYFSPLIKQNGTKPLLMTTNLMAPEGYVLHAFVDGWINGKSDSAIHEQVAQAYNRYQKSGIKGARKLFKTQ